MGLEHDSEKVSRDIAVFSLSDNGLREKVRNNRNVFSFCFVHRGYNHGWILL